MTLSDHRRELNLTQSELAERLDLSERTVQRLEAKGTDLPKWLRLALRALNTNQKAG